MPSSQCRWEVKWDCVHECDSYVVWQVVGTQYMSFPGATFGGFLILNDKAHFLASTTHRYYGNMRHIRCHVAVFKVNQH